MSHPYLLAFNLFAELPQARASLRKNVLAMNSNCSSPGPFVAGGIKSLADYSQPSKVYLVRRGATSPAGAGRLVTRATATAIRRRTPAGVEGDIKASRRVLNVAGGLGNKECYAPADEYQAVVKAQVFRPEKVGGEGRQRARPPHIANRLFQRPGTGKIYCLT